MSNTRVDQLCEIPQNYIFDSDETISIPSTDPGVGSPFFTATAPIQLEETDVKSQAITEKKS